MKFVVIPIILIAQAVAAYFLVGHYFLDDSEKSNAPTPKEEAKTVGQFLEIKDIVINPAGTLGRRYLVFAMGLETHNAELLEEARMKKIRIRDAIISMLTEKTPEELLDITKRDQLKQELLQTVNKNLSRGKFHKLYFTKYIMQ